MKSKKYGGNKKAITVLALKQEIKGLIFCDTDHEKEIKKRAKARLDFWAVHLKTRRPRGQKPLKGLEQDERVPSGPSAW